MYCPFSLPFVICPISIGMLPLKWLKPSCKFCNFDSCPMAAGKVPVKSFLLSLSCKRFVHVKSCTSNESCPEKLLFARESICMFLKCGRSFGRFPFKSLFERSRIKSEDKLATLPTGKVPERPASFSLICNICKPISVNPQITPGEQEQGSSRAKGVQHLPQPS